jgi:hypothetical protein
VPDPVSDTMMDRLEATLQDFLLANSDLDRLKVVFRGEPGIVHVKLYPFAIVFLTRARPARGEDGYGQSTGYEHWRYEGFISVEVLIPDTRGMVPGPDRKVTIPSYAGSKEMTQAVVQSLESWDLDEDPVISNDGKTRTTGIFWIDDVTNGIEGRGPETVANRGTARFHMYSKKQLW